MTIHWLARGIHDVPHRANWLSPDESARLAGTRFPKRYSELRLARWTAKHAIARTLGLDTRDCTLAGIEIRPAPTGAPVAWVAGRRAPVAVSMTDRADWAVCMVGPADATLGCDLELVEPREEAFVRDWFTPHECDLVAAGDRDLLANLVWSATESALKVLRTGLRRDTRSVEVDLLDRAGAQRWARLVVRSSEGGVFPGWWRRYGQFLLTFAATADHGSPVCLEDPPALTVAAPSHLWLTGRCTAPSRVPAPTRDRAAANRLG